MNSSAIDLDDLRGEAIRLCNDPDDFFGNSYNNTQTIPRDQLAALQEEAMKYRFETLVDKIPMLKRLADKQGIEKIDGIDDVVPLLFEHTMYKSYPPFLLEQNRFSDINKFLSKLTSIDLSGVDVSACKSIDEWLEVMDRDSDIYLGLSSGTSGVMSFIPSSKREWDKRWKQMKSVVNDASAGSDEELYCIFPYFRRGPSHMRGNDWTVKHIVGDEEHFIAAYPETQSCDVMYFAARMRAAKARGKLDSLQVPPQLLDRLKAFEEQQKNMQSHLTEFFERVVNEYKGKRVYLSGAWSLLHNLAKKGLDNGVEGVFSPDSYVQSGGGAKGMTPPENWQEDICRFIGIDKLVMGYSMTEINTMNYMCEHGHYHLSPVAIPFVLDHETSKPLPRKGVQTGRAAFYDLGCETRWGGFITGDEITVNWEDKCPCGRESQFIVGDIERYSEKQGGDDKITCAATASAHEEAMEYLTKVESGISDT